MNIKEETSQYYLTESGQLIYKAAFHQERGKCCFNYCLHCPYGTTVEKYGLKVKVIDAHQVDFYLKGFHCATLYHKENRLVVNPLFRDQSLEDDIDLTWRIFCKDKDEQ